MIKLFFSLLVVTSSAFGAGKIQSRFLGPTSLHVWKHWQPSWNVAQASHNYEFELVRSENRPEVRLSMYALSGPKYRAYLTCESWVRTGLWSVERKTGETHGVEATVDTDHGTVSFEWPNAKECLDQSEKNLTQKIDFRVETKEGKEVYRSTVLPMYVRGKNAVYWNNPTDPYKAHAGQGKNGDLLVGNMMSGEREWDVWNGVVVKPLLNFVDRNTMKKGTDVGLHRHEANQEAYLIESGEGEMTMGVAERKGANYTGRRADDRDGPLKDVEEFAAKGGWIEIRNLVAGDMAIIVPDSKQKDTVFFHGMRALTSDVVFWTMGSRN